MSYSGMSTTANKITRRHGYSPCGNMLYVPRGNQEHPQIKSEIWHTAFVESMIKEPFPHGYDGMEIRIQTEEDDVLRFTLVYRKVEIAMVDPDGHFGVLPHTTDLESAEEFAAHYNVKPILKEPPSLLKDFIEGLDTTGI